LLMGTLDQFYKKIDQLSVRPAAIVSMRRTFPIPISG
jgi:hypothetical protein